MRHFIIAKSEKRKNTFYSLWEEDIKKGFHQPFARLHGGELSFNTLCKALIEQLRPQNKKATGFTVTNLHSTKMVVEQSSSLALLFPLNNEEMENFHQEYKIVGRY